MAVSPRALSDEYQPWFDPAAVIGEHIEDLDSKDVLDIWKNQWRRTIPQCSKIDLDGPWLPWIHVASNKTFRPTTLIEHVQRIFIILLCIRHASDISMKNATESEIIHKCREEWLVDYTHRLRIDPNYLNYDFSNFIQEFLDFQYTPMELPNSPMFVELARRAGSIAASEKIFELYITNISSGYSKDRQKFLRQKVENRLEIAYDALKSKKIKIPPPLFDEPSDFFVFLMRVYSLCFLKNPSFSGCESADDNSLMGRPSGSLSARREHSNGLERFVANPVQHRTIEEP